MQGRQHLSLAYMGDQLFCAYTSSPECHSDGRGQLYTALGYQHGPWWQTRAETSAGPLVVAWTTDIDTNLYCYMAVDPGKASGGRAGYSHQAVSHHIGISSFTSLHNAQTVLLLFLSHLSTTCLHIIVQYHSYQIYINIIPESYTKNVFSISILVLLTSFLLFVLPSFLSSFLPSFLSSCSFIF